MGAFNFRYFKPSHLILTILLLGTTVSWLLKFINGLTQSQWNVELNFLTTGIILTGFFALVNNCLWKYPPFSWMLTVPNIGGRYEGFITFKAPKETEERKMCCIMAINQTASNIFVEAMFTDLGGKWSSDGKSREANLVNEGGTFKLIYTYLNEGNTANKFPPHYGSSVLKFVQRQKEKSLEGIYYTNRIPQTNGSVLISWTGDELVL